MNSLNLFKVNIRGCEANIGCITDYFATKFDQQQTFTFTRIGPIITEKYILYSANKFSHQRLNLSYFGYICPREQLLQLFFDHCGYFYVSFSEMNHDLGYVGPLRRIYFVEEKDH